MVPTERFDLIYLNTRGSQWFNDWVYYRTGSDGGNTNDPITICRVEWPSLKDVDLIWDERKAVITSPGLTGLASAQDQTWTLMRSRWDVEPKDSILIGALFAPVK
jgi:hypothetical protein